MDSRISGFYKLDLKSRQEKIKAASDLSKEDVEAFSEEGLTFDMADNMVENVIGLFQLPVGVALNFIINDVDYLIPMVTEEPSVIAAASNAAKMIRSGGGFNASATEPIMVGQIQVLNAKKNALDIINSKKTGYMEFLRSVDPTLVKFGGGVRDITARYVKDMFIIHVHVNVADAMGANAVNTMCEKLSPKITEDIGGEIILKILSNFAVERTATAKAVVPKEAVGGEKIVERIIKAFELARDDIYRAVTHNKGVMNGVTAVVLATGNDTRAVEAGCHAYAAKDGVYTSLTKWQKNVNGDLEGEITIPVAVGLIGGATRTHPIAKKSIKLLNVKSAKELGMVLACVGLAQNLAAIRALASEGIQQGHMRLHAKNIAIIAGAKPGEIETVAIALVKSSEINVDNAKKILEELR